MSPVPHYLPLLAISTNDWERLLAPISEESPCGRSLVYEGTYDEIREARRQDDPTLPQGDWQIELKKANWVQVRDLCVEALTKRTKDLQIAAWFTEALLWLHGYTGLKAGLQLIIHFCENYWETVYPLLEENGDVEMRISSLVWINEKLSLQLGNVAITAPATRDAFPYTFIDHEEAWLLENRASIKEKQAAEAAGKPTRAKFLTSATLTPREFCVNLATDLRESIEYVDTLNHLLDNLCSRQAPGLGKFRDTLVNIQRVVETMLKDKPSEVDSNAEIFEENTSTDTTISDDKLFIKNANLPIRSRGEAYRRLAEAADFLMQHEPHSPTPYLVKRAIKWGNMSLTELLMELVNNNSDLAAIYQLLGIKSDE